MKLHYDQIFVPTRYVSTRKLSNEIRSWYLANIGNVTRGVVRESIQGEESMAMRLSIPEHAPTSPAAVEIRALLSEIWSHLVNHTKAQGR
jgi:cellulose biosynthesis protein BcsQ